MSNGCQRSSPSASSTAAKTTSQSGTTVCTKCNKTFPEKPLKVKGNLYCNKCGREEYLRLVSEMQKSKSTGEAEKRTREQLAHERAEQEKREQERKEREQKEEQLRKEQEEKEKREKEEKERREREEHEKQTREKAEKEKKEKEEKEKKEKEERERKEKERKEKEQKEKEQKEKEERERKEKEQREKEQKEKKERERKEKERKEKLSQTHSASSTDKERKNTALDALRRAQESALKFEQRKQKAASLKPATPTASFSKSSDALDKASPEPPTTSNESATTTATVPSVATTAAASSSPSCAVVTPVQPASLSATPKPAVASTEAVRPRRTRTGAFVSTAMAEEDTFDPKQQLDDLIAAGYSGDLLDAPRIPKPQFIEGFLQKLKKNGKLVMRWFSLQDSRLVYYKKKQRRETFACESLPNGMIDLAFYEVEVKSDRIIFSSPERSYTLFPSTKNDMEKWSQKLNLVYILFDLLIFM